MGHPAFLYLGAQKAGSGWLYDQFAAHRDYWMPPIKELKFFDRGFSENTRAKAERQLHWKGIKHGRGEADYSQDIDFLLRLLHGRVRLDKHDFATYFTLFENRPGLSADITPSYCKLQTPMAQAIYDQMPETRFVMMLRDPADRLWSQLQMRVRLGRNKGADLTSDLKALAAFAQSDQNRMTSFLSHAIRRWRALDDQARFAVFLMDDLKRDPDRFRAAIAAHVGAATSTQIVVFNSATGVTTTITGTGMAFNTSTGEATAGTVTGFSFSSGGTVQGTITGISWGLVAFGSALDDMADSGDATAMGVLLNSSGAITVDASGAAGGYDMYADFENLAPLITQDMTITGSGSHDALIGGSGDDLITPGAGNSEVYNSTGNDTINYAGVGADIWHDLYHETGEDLTITVDGSAGTGSVTGTGFNTTLQNTDEPMNSWGLSLGGGWGNDTFNLTAASGQWMSAAGMDGNDTFNLTITEGTIRLSYNWYFDQGMVADFSTGVVSNDGRGFTDQVNILSFSGRGRLEISGTDFADDITGSDYRDSFITEQGNDTIDGGGGWDRIRYNRSGVDSGVTADLLAGTATGTWDGVAFSHTLSNIEQINGSDYADSLSGDHGENWMGGNEGNDTIDGRDGWDGTWYNEDLSEATITEIANGGLQVVSAEGTDLLYNLQEIEFSDQSITIADFIAGRNLVGTNAGETLDGHAGHDSFDAGRGADLLNAYGGNDDMWGDGGNDTLYGGEGNDTIRGGRENDLIDGGDGQDSIVGQRHGDTIDGGRGDDTIKGGGGGDSLSGGDGDDFIKGGTYQDKVYGGDGDDTITGNRHDDYLDGGEGNDSINAGGDSDTLVGGTGDDRLKGGGGADVFIFDTGHDADEITDFNITQDTLEISAGLAGGQTAAQIASGASVTADGVLIDFGGGDTILLDGLTTTTGLDAAIDIV